MDTNLLQLGYWNFVSLELTPELDTVSYPQNTAGGFFIGITLQKEGVVPVIYDLCF